jgi:glutathione S-transferase
MFAALNSVEPHVQNWIHLDDRNADEGWANERRAELQGRLNQRLEGLSAWLGRKECLESRFTAGDLMMTTVLRELVPSGALAQFPVLDTYRRRCEARPAFGRAMEAHMQPFRESTSA